MLCLTLFLKSNWAVPISQNTLLQQSNIRLNVSGLWNVNSEDPLHLTIRADYKLLSSHCPMIYLKQDPSTKVS